MAMFYVRKIEKNYFQTEYQWVYGLIYDLFFLKTKKKKKIRFLFFKNMDVDTNMAAKTISMDKQYTWV